MNLVIKPALTAIALPLALCISLLQGCAYNTPSSPQPALDTPAEPALDEHASAPEAKPTAEITPEPKAIPFEEVLKQDQAAQNNAATPPPAPAPKTVAPKKEKLPLNPSTPLRAPSRPPQTASLPEAQTPAVKPPITTKPNVETEQPAPAPAPTAPLEFTLDQLPITIQNTWLLSSNQTDCELRTIPVKMEDGAGKTTLFLQLTQANWMIHTKSDIDLSYKDTGLFLDNGTHIQLETLVKDTNIAISKQKKTLTDALMTADNVKVVLGFWPTWPVSEARTHTLSVAHFPQAFATWKTCNQLVGAR